MVNKLKKKIKNTFFILGNRDRPIIPFKVNLLYWKKQGAVENVGDLLSKILLEYLIIHFNLVKKNVKTYRLSIIGSLIQSLPSGSTVWGSGLLDENAIYRLDSNIELDLRCVRGPETRKMLINKGYDCPEVYGDPAILFSQFYTPSETFKNNKVLIIPHFLTIENYSKYDNVLSTLTNDWKEFINRIVNSKFVISASLHGIILAETYGIPAIFLNDVQTDIFKYNDYYFSTGRFNYKIANTVEDAMRMGPENLPDLSILQKRILNHFPTDIWGSNI